MESLIVDNSLIVELAQKLSDYKAEEVKIYRVKEVVDYTDYVLILTANSAPHARALFQQTQDFFKMKGINSYVRHKRLEQHQWIICDYVDVVVHIMEKEKRDYYQLEKLFDAYEVVF